MSTKPDSSTAAMEAAYQEALKGFDCGDPIPWSQVNMAELFKAGWDAGRDFWKEERDREITRRAA